MSNRTPIKLKSEDHWVSCTRYDAPDSIYKHRHIVQKGGLTTACGATGMPSHVWQPNRKKPVCESCIRHYTSQGK